MRNQSLHLSLALVALTLITYATVVQYGFIWDDNAYVFENETLRSLAGLRQIWLEIGATPQYYPLVHTSYWLEYRLWGLEPAGYHLVNVLLHALAALLAWRVLLKLEVPGAWGAAAIFAVHPVHAESVAWITERKNVLSAVFYLGSALAYLSSIAAASLRRSRLLYIYSLLLFVGALLSKTVTGSLPAALLLVIWGSKRGVESRDVLRLLPFFALALGLGALTIWMEKVRVGAVGADWDLSAVERLLIAGRAVWFYLAKLAWPSSLSFVYPRWRIDPGIGWQYLFPGAAILAVAVLWRLRNRLGRGPLVAILFFGGTLVPALGFFDVYPMRYSFVADHFQYLASLGPIALLTATASRGVVGRGGALRTAAGVVLAVAVLGLAQLSWRRLPAFRNLESLWTATIEVNPNAWLAHYNLANLRRREGDLVAAIHHYRRAVDAKSDLAEAHNNLATCLGLTGRVDDALHHYRRAIAVDPEHALAQFNLARVLEARGEGAQAIEHYRAALRAQPEYPQAQQRLGLLLQGPGEPGARADPVRREAVGVRELEIR